MASDLFTVFFWGCLFNVFMGKKLQHYIFIRLQYPHVTKQLINIKVKKGQFCLLNILLGQNRINIYVQSIVDEKELRSCLLYLIQIFDVMKCFMRKTNFDYSLQHGAMELQITILHYLFCLIQSLWHGLDMKK